MTFNLMNFSTKICNFTHINWIAKVIAVRSHAVQVTIVIRFGACRNAGIDACRDANISFAQ